MLNHPALSWLMFSGLVLAASCTEGTGHVAGTLGGSGGEGAGEGASRADGGSAGAARHDGVSGTVSVDPFAQCAVPTYPCGAPDEVCGCTPELFCDTHSSNPVTWCGQPGSFFDGSGCRRQSCTGDEECAAGFRCVPSGLVFDGCLSSQIDLCDDCGCIATDDCGGTITCIEIELAPPENDCDLSMNDCPSIDRRDGLTGALQQRDLSDALRETVEACLTDVLAAREVCDPGYDF